MPEPAIDIEALMRRVAERAKQPPRRDPDFEEVPGDEVSSAEKLGFVLRRLRYSREKCIDDLPAKILLPGDPSYDKYKCRMSWWTRVQMYLWYIKNNQLLPGIDELANEFKFYIDGLQRRRFEQEKLTGESRVTRSDIDFANNFLDKVNNLLNKAQNQETN